MQLAEGEDEVELVVMVYNHSRGVTLGCSGPGQVVRQAIKGGAIDLEKIEKAIKHCASVIERAWPGTYEHQTKINDTAD